MGSFDSGGFGMIGGYGMMGGFGNPNSNYQTIDSNEAPKAMNTSLQNASILASQSGTYYYICQVPGHATNGMYGEFIIE